jgi:RecB family endonuclease NucS
MTVNREREQPAVGDIEQLRRYLSHLLNEKNLDGRGILVHVSV